MGNLLLGSTSTSTSTTTSRQHVNGATQNYPLHLTIAILILAIWTGTTSAVNKQKCIYGGNVKCVDVVYGGRLVKKELCIQTVLGRYWCASSVKSDGTYLNWDYNCRTCE